MKTIKEFIKEYTPDRISKNKWFYDELYEYYNGNIPNKYLTLYNECNLLDFTYLNENLQTHDYKKLQHQLLKEYDKYIDRFIDYNGTKYKKSFYIILKNKENKLNEDKFFSILDFFNYKYSNYEIINDELCLYIEPIYSEDASSYFDKCHRQAYHFTYKKNVASILENGLRLKTGNYRNFPKRIYIWAQENSKLNKDVILDFIHKIFSNDNLTLNDIGIIKIDLNHTNIPVYKDTAIQYKEALFVYNNIPSNLCKEIHIN